MIRPLSLCGNLGGLDAACGQPSLGTEHRGGLAESRLGHRSRTTLPTLAVVGSVDEPAGRSARTWKTC